MDRTAGVILIGLVGIAHANPLKKAELRPALKKIFPQLTACYEKELARDRTITGVVNTELTVVNDPKVGMKLTVTGFDTEGPLGESKTFRACVKSVWEARVWPAAKTAGRLDFIYPGTFGTEPVGDKDKPLVDKAQQAITDGKWADALALAKQGLSLVTMAGPLRHQLIGIAGVAGCRLKDEPTARHFYALASPEFEPAIETSCQDAGVDLPK
ncbi:MAG: hypothetical protein QM831_16755 [Kofleriaceae bacterium]